VRHWFRPGLRLITCCMLLLAGLPVAGQTGTAQPDLRIWAPPSFVAAFEAFGLAYTAEFGVPVTVTAYEGVSLLDTYYNTVAEGERGPDLIVGAHDWLANLQVNGLERALPAVDLDGLFLPQALAAFTHDGVRYGLPFAVDSVALVRNTALVPEAPATWAAVKAESERLVLARLAESGFMQQTGDFLSFYPVLTAYGGYVFGLDEAGAYTTEDIGLDNAGALAAADWYYDYMFRVFARAGAGDEDMHDLFRVGEMAMFVTDARSIPLLDAGGQPYAISALPEGPAGPARPWLNVYGVYPAGLAEQPLLAESFLLDFMATDEAMAILAEALPLAPAWSQARAAVTDPARRAFVDSSAQGDVLPTGEMMITAWPQLELAMRRVDQRIFTGFDAFRIAAAELRLAYGDDAASTAD
jgi:arabinogalactan oligomer / maltooligosaccharide transport system substrate-binding protein